MKYPYLRTLPTLKQIGCWLSLVTIVGWNGVSLAQAPVFVPPPPDQGAPTGRRQGGATRGKCLDYQGLTALVPQVEGVVWSQTASTTPRFFFYVPAALNSDIPLEFVIQDRDDTYVFRKGFFVDAAAGILAIPVAPDAELNNAELNLDETYTWTFVIYCDPERPSASVSVTGTVMRVADSVATNPTAELDPAAQLDRVRQYAAAGIWHEAFSGAIALYQTDPNNATYVETLQALMEQSDLADISLPETIFECCETP